MENNLSETAFFVKNGREFHIRWFTPEMEIDLCGHATLASAHVIFDYLNYHEKMIRFTYAAGNLLVTKSRDMLSMDFPSVKSRPHQLTDEIRSCFDIPPREIYKARDLMVVFNSEKDIRHIRPNLAKLSDLDALGIIVTAPGDQVDFVSRFFAPRAGINEDPVTGSAHCMLIPYWAERLNKNQMNALQLSKRVGALTCENRGSRVWIAGKAITYMIGDILI